MNAQTYRMIYRKTAIFMLHFVSLIPGLYHVDADVRGETMARLEDERKIAYLTLGLAGEVGEVANKMKKYLRGDFSIDTEVRLWLIKELGDILWYVAGICDWLGVSMDYVMQVNAEKLLDRKERGVLQGDGDDR